VAGLLQREPRRARGALARRKQQTPLQQVGREPHMGRAWVFSLLLNLYSWLCLFNQ
jgi:hypothetical protein